MQISFLARNLQAYMTRYPWDFQRLASCLNASDVPNDFELPTYTVSEPQSSYIPRICVVAGIFDPKTLEEISKVWKSDAYFVIESDPQILTYQFHNTDLTHLINAHSVYLFLGYNKESIVAPIQRVMRQSFHASRLRLTQILCHDLEDTKMKPECKDLYQNLIKIYAEITDHVYFNFGNMFDSLEGLRATLANEAFIKNSDGIQAIENKYKGLPFVVIGAGPSLDADLPLLKQHQDKFIIVAVDAAAKVLEAAEIRYDYVCSLERFNIMQDKFFRDLKPSKAELIAYPVVHTEVLKLWPGKVRIVYRNYAWYAYFEKNWPQGILESGGSASHLATKASYFLGAETVYLLGCDMSYEQVNDLFRSHCQSTAYPEWANLKTKLDMDNNPDYGPSYQVEANDGTLVWTNQVYHQWAKEYGSISLAMNLGGRLKSCSLKGLKIPGVSYVNFAEVCESLPNIPPQIDHSTPPPAPDLSKVNTKLNDNQILIDNLKGYLTHTKSSFEFLNNLTEETATEEAVEMAAILFYNKMAHETLFTAFIIQNCASEFFYRETVFNSFTKEDSPYKRASALAGMYKIVTNCLTYTIDMLEEAKQGKIRDKVNI